MKKCRRIDLILLVVLCLWLAAGAAFGAAAITVLGNAPKEPTKGKGALSAIEIPAPANEWERNYLGLSASGTSTLGQIKAPVLIIEVYSFYCPHCQSSAAQVNELYQMIKNRPELKDNIKIIGIAAANSAYEVEAYRKRYGVPFPLFPDEEMEISKKLGVRGTPTFIGLKAQGGQIQEQFLFLEGGEESAEQFLDEIIKRSGLK